MRSGFFDDTEVWSEDFARFAAGLLTDGVLADTADALKATAAGDSMQVQIAPGYCWIKGHFGLAETAESVTIETADGSLPRIDRIVARLDWSSNSVHLHVLTGTPAATPAPPDPVRDGTYYDIGLARVALPAGALAVTNSMITDTRNDAAVCGGVVYRNADALALDGKADKTSLPKINGSLAYNNNSAFYAPTVPGSSGHYLKSSGSSPTWQAPSTTPTSGSGTLITSGAVHNAFETFNVFRATLIFDGTITGGGDFNENWVSTGNIPVELARNFEYLLFVENPSTYYNVACRCGMGPVGYGNESNNYNIYVPYSTAFYIKAYSNSVYEGSTKVAEKYYFKQSEVGSSVWKVYGIKNQADSILS